jgi:NAD(P)H-quinone oxidoreductase subunit 4
VFPVQTLLSMIGTGLTAVYFLLLINRAFFGRLSEQVVNLPPVQWSDRIPAIVLAVFVVILGLLPSGLVAYSETSATALSLGRPALNAAVHQEAIAPADESGIPTLFSLNP